MSSTVSRSGDSAEAVEPECHEDEGDLEGAPVSAVGDVPPVGDVERVDDFDPLLVAVVPRLSRVSPAAAELLEEHRVVRELERAARARLGIEKVESRAHAREDELPLG